MGGSDGKSTLQIATYNVQGINTNILYVEELLKKHDIVCLQEHWLWGFEKQDLNLMLPQCGVQIRSVDDGNEILEHSHRITGHGGVATLWKKHLNVNMKPVDEEGNCRILVTEYNSKPPVCIINCYLPSGKSKQATDNFEEDIDTLNVLLAKYRSSHQIIMLGDFNADHYHRKGRKEKMLQELVRENNLNDPGIDTSQDPSYINPHLQHQSRIDHIFIWQSEVDEYHTQVSMVKAEAVENFSYHSPLSTRITVGGVKLKSHNKKSKRVVLLRRNLDEDLYRSTVEELVQNINPDLLSPQSALTAIQQALIGAVEVATPRKVVKLKQGKSTHWSQELALAVRKSKEIHFQWKSLGRPKGDHPLATDRKNASRDVRRTLRRQKAEERVQLLTEISQATERDQQLANKLIKKRRGHTQETTAIWIKGNLVVDQDQLKNSWADYCEDLAHPKESLTSDQVKLLQYMRMISSQRARNININRETISTAIRKMKKGKAADANGLAAEHLRLLPNGIVDTLAYIFEKTIEEKIIPNSLKSAYKLMIPKPGKDSSLMDNYRGITIAPILLKVLEYICMEDNLKEEIDGLQSDLQVGFTNNRSPSMASLIITEAIADSRKSKRPLVITSLDARKAFDVVNHYQLKVKLFNSNINPKWWEIIDNLYVDSNECVRWKGQDSRHYKVNQGVKQGSLISPHLYKLYINDLLVNLEKSGLGIQIGTIFIGCPTCADDVTLITNDSNQVQPLLDIAQTYADAHGYQLHPNKSTITELVRIRRQDKNKGKEGHQWTLKDKEVTVTESFTHLGLSWTATKCKPDVSMNIKKARRAAYALLNIGMHGGNGLDPAASCKILQTYVTPILIHGLEAAVLNKEDLDAMEKFYRKILRQIQSLPDSTACEAVYLLSGRIPIEGLIHQRALGLFGAICRLPYDNNIRKLAARQMAVGDNQYSWFYMIGQLGTRYSINVNENLIWPRPKAQWKEEVKRTVNNFWTAKLQSETVHKKTLEWFITRTDTAQVHPLWLTCAGDPRKVEAAATRARLLVGRFSTQSVRARYSGSGSKLCQLCLEEDEDTIHLLIRCHRLQHCRSNKVEILKQLYAEEKLPPPNTDQEICSAILNGDCFISSTQLSPLQMLADIVRISNPDLIYRSNMVASLLCISLVKERDFILNNNS